MSIVPAIRITGDRLYPEPISPLIYGEFVELLNDLIPGMRAEKVEDRSFEGVLQPAYTYPPGQDWTRPRWRSFASGWPGFDHWPVQPEELDAPGATASLAIDLDNPYAGRRSARVTVAGDASRSFLAGIAQEGIAVRAGEQLIFQLHLRSDDLAGASARLMLGRDYGVFFKTYATAELDGVGGSWRLFEGTLVPDVTDDDATLVIGASAPGTFWVDMVSLMPCDHVLGWRRDVVEAVRATRPGVIRFGGSSLIYYDWRIGIGPRDKRAAFENRPWGNMEDNDVGLHEFLQFCEQVEAEPLICLNSNSTTVEDILAEIEYCNGPADSLHGGLRADMGHPEPFRVKYWQIGNEQSGEEYEQRMVDYARAIRSRHPELVLLASYPSDAILRNLSDEVDYVCPHLYAPYSPAIEKEVQGLIDAIGRTATNKGLKLGVTEWNHTASHWGWGRSWLLTLYNALNAACMFNLYQRHGNTVRIANRSNLVNSCCSGSIQTTRSGIYFTPCYYTQTAYANLAGDAAVRVEADPDEALDLAATRRSADGQVALFAVNVTPRPLRRTIHFATGRASGHAQAWSLSGPSLDAVNSFADPDRVSPGESEFAFDGQSLSYEFPPYSITILRV